jgi:hypothetical protein
MYHTSRVRQSGYVEIVFVESPPFSRRIATLGLEEELRELQEALRRNPLAGSVDAGTGGMRKVRMRRPGRGKRGGARVHYLYLESVAVIYMGFVYGKDEQDALTPEQKKAFQLVSVHVKRELEDLMGADQE